jgi:hypothetical protein
MGIRERCSGEIFIQEGVARRGGVIHFETGKLRRQLSRSRLWTARRYKVLDSFAGESNYQNPYTPFR